VVHLCERGLKPVDLVPERVGALPKLLRVSVAGRGLCRPRAPLEPVEPLQLRREPLRARQQRLDLGAAADAGSLHLLDPRRDGGELAPHRLGAIFPRAGAGDEHRQDREASGAHEPPSPEASAFASPYFSSL
jgi:hypothetical protein